MLDRILTDHPWLALGAIIIVVYLAGAYFTQRERAKVNRMRGMKRFTPEWSSGRRHRSRSKSTNRFSPQWKRGSSHRAQSGDHAPAEGASDSEAPPDSDRK